MPGAAWFAETLDRELRPWLTLSDEQIGQLYRHYQQLERWNDKVNLTSLEPGEELVVRHYCESLFLGVHLPIERGGRIADIGSGAGFPGVPVAVFRPDSRVVLMDSVQRKAVFLREATRHLSNIEVLAKRAEAVDGQFDWIVSRAVNPKDVLRNLPRIARRIGLLLGESGVREAESVPGIAWSEPIQLPWGDRKFLIMGSST
jgi:16S rRNA (guanine527-N7)-methyltransferase